MGGSTDCDGAILLQGEQLVRVHGLDVLCDARPKD